MLTSELDYTLPPELISQHPAEPRDTSRLLVVDRATGSITHAGFRDIGSWLQPADLLVANDSRVLAARLKGRKRSGGKVELLLLRRLDDRRWVALVSGRNVTTLRFERDGVGVNARVLENHGGGEAIVEFDSAIEPLLPKLGEAPLPPYIHETLADPDRYQTVYARVTGSAAAPTAGLHFTPRLIDSLRERGVGFEFVTLHVGVDTFKPIHGDTVEGHFIHSEWCEVPQRTVDAIAVARAASARVVAVGTTSVRSLESAAGQGGDSGPLAAYSGATRLFITPGTPFRVVDAMITNFHLPRSTLLALVGAFMGMDLWRAAYAEAIREKYRFYSFGDAMLIL
ncbi:MAG: tRNA preQ1(34) S-adenosylmethionine ribosyltransferase-isomerase QueA [Thermoflexales bacterium]